MDTRISPEEWERYERDGYLNLGKVLNDEDLSALQQRMDDIMLGIAPVDYSRLMMQLDSDTGKYGDMKEMSKGHKGATLNYRKIQELEFDSFFLAYMQRPVFRDICTHVYGEDVPIHCFRAMFMNKPAHKGTLLPWHQDRWRHLDRDPLVTVWTALDPATNANGCVQVIPGSHGRLINPDHPSGFLTEELAMQHCPDEKAVYLELAAGEVLLLHNWLLHRSDVNRTDIARRGFSVCYMDGRTQAANGERYTRIFGDDALTVEELARRKTAGV